MPRLEGQPSYITEPKTWDVDLLDYTTLEVTLMGGTFTIGDVTVSRFPAPATASLSNISSSASNQTALSANSDRQGATFVNDTDKTCYLKLGATASSSSFTVRLYSTQTYELPVPVYTGRVDVIWESGPTGSLRITEVSA